MGPSWFLLAAAKKLERGPGGPSVRMVCGIEKLSNGSKFTIEPIEPYRRKLLEKGTFQN